ncbi:MAG TPA: Lrp/AsnC family transcriptional regulator [Candidatus Woesearchaeota archaeon]|nr:Lrp/AsnC family transcriptional regulator [Candidatus Woesearchaeota archaeon]
MKANEKWELDELDRKIIRYLLQNAKASFRKISRALRITSVTALNRIKKLEEKGIIIGYSVKLDMEKAGFDVNAIIKLRISKGKLFEVEKKIAIHKRVVAVYDVTGDFDCIIIGKFKSRKELDVFLKDTQTYDFIERTETILILNVIKEDNIADI